MKGDRLHHPGRQRGRNARSNELVASPNDDVIRVALGGLCRHELFVALRLQDLPELSAGLTATRSREGSFGSFTPRYPLDRLAFGAGCAQPLALQREVREQGRIASEAASSGVASRLANQLVFGVTQHAALLGPIPYAAAASGLVVGEVDDRCMSSRRGWRVTAARISPRDLT